MFQRQAILLLRVPHETKLADQIAYEYLSGFDDRGSQPGPIPTREASPVLKMA